MSGRKSARTAERVFAVSVWLILALLAWPRGAAAEQRYVFDQRFGSIGFTVHHLGLFSSEGDFRRFHAQLALDDKHPDRTQISVQVQAGSVKMAWQQAEDMLRSDDFLDVRRYPEISFTSTSVIPAAPDHYIVHGMLQLHGVTRPLVLLATLTDRQHNLADFVVTGALQRSMYGMTADESFISNRVQLTIRMRLQLSEPARAG